MTKTEALTSILDSINAAKYCLIPAVRLRHHADQFGFSLYDQILEAERVLANLKEEAERALGSAGSY